jgi:predicted AAA+ superfamily ATPase
MEPPMTLIKRTGYIEKIQAAFTINPVTALLGPRQCGKTTLAQEYARRNSGNQTVHFFDLENPNDLARLETPQLTLENLEGLIIIDEIQRRPELFSLLRVLVDQHKKRRFLILGSASRELIKQSSESLAGRISYLELTPFSYPEIDDLDRLWVRGGFPHAYLANNQEISAEWRIAYIKTFLEQDIPNLGITIPANTLRRFWMMLAHYHGNIFNASELGQSLGAAHTTIRHYLDILTGTFMIRELTPWIENIEKRQIKSPKIYFRDSGIFHTLLGIENQNALHHHPKLGASWEGFALEEIIRHHQATSSEAYFWGVHNQAELDLLLVTKGKKLGFEFKYTDAPRLTKSQTIAQEILELDEFTVIYPGKKSYSLSEKVRAVGLEEYLRTYHIVIPRRI